MKTKKFLCGGCNQEVSDNQKYCNHCGVLLDACVKSKLPKKKNLKDQDEDFIGEEGEESMDVDFEEVYNNLLEEYPEDTPSFFGSLNEFEKMIEGITSDGDISPSEAIDGLMQMFYQYLDDPEGFLEELDEPDDSEAEEEMEGDSISTNKKTGYVMDLLTKIPGISKGKAMAIMAYHGSLGNIRGMKDTKQLLKYKYLKNTLSEEDAAAVIEYFSKQKTKKKSKMGVVELGQQDSTKKKFICGGCKTEVTDSQKFCTNCGSQLGDALPTDIMREDMVSFTVGGVKHSGRVLSKTGNSFVVEDADGKKHTLDIKELTKI